MPRATCRCGEPLNVPNDGPERIVCPKCGAKIRVRRPSAAGAGAGGGDADGFIRFSCPCGRRLKVRAADAAPTGKCPDCGRLVPIPAESRPADAETPTRDLDPEDLAQLDAWAKNRQGRPPSAKPAAAKLEAGLRVCPKCGKPVHLNALVCQSCGAHVPKR